MEDSRRKLEIADRLAEIEHGLAGLRVRNDQAARYVRLELERLTGECREYRDAWTAVTEQAEALLATLDRESGDT